MIDKPGTGIAKTVGDLRRILRQYDDDTPILMSGGEHASYYDTIYVGGAVLISPETGEEFDEHQLRDNGWSEESIEHEKLSAKVTVVLL